MHIYLSNYAIMHKRLKTPFCISDDCEHLSFLVFHRKRFSLNFLKVPAGGSLACMVDVGSKRRNDDH